MKNDVTINDIRQARERVSSVARRTPLEHSRWLTDELKRDVFVKLECFQETGSFKIRGAMAKLSRLTADERARGVLTVSAGNHGLAIAHCAQALSLEVTIIVPRSASPAKIAAIRRYPVTLIERGANYDEAESSAREMERETSATFVSPYNDADVIAGQGTVALEILEDAPNLDAIVVPVGGGGLLAGVSVAVKANYPHVEVYGAEPAASPTMSEALRRGRIVEMKEEETIADGLAGNIEPGSITFPIIERLVDGIILVSEEAIRGAIKRVASEDRIMIEGAAAASLAALTDARLSGQRTAAIVTGRNISLDLFGRIIATR